MIHKILVLSSLFFGPASLAVSAEGNKQEIRSACTVDAIAATCDPKASNKKTLRCILDYKKTHKNFKLSSSCQNTLRNMGSNHRMKKVPTAP